MVAGKVAIVASSTDRGLPTERDAGIQPPAIAPSDHPGRWLGGAIGALTSLAAAVIAGTVDADPGIFDWDSWSVVGLLGIPIGFVLGRELLPMARGEGWRRALWVGMLFGWVAPPLGAVEILAGSRLMDVGNLTTGVAGPVALLLLPVALPISFLAILMTIPVGIAWGALVRLVPDGAFVRLRAPRVLERLGVRHALFVIVFGLIAIELGAAWRR